MIRNTKWMFLDKEEEKVVLSRYKIEEIGISNKELIDEATKRYNGVFLSTSDTDG